MLVVTCLEMVMRLIAFIVLFAGLVAIQMLASHFINGFARIYAPFVYLVEPIVRTHYVGSGATLRVIIWGVWLGTFVYSAVLAFVGTFLISKTVSTSSSEL